MEGNYFTRWKEEECDRFINLGSGRLMYGKEIILQKLGDSGRLDLQYRQLVVEIMKKANVFWPSMFEVLVSMGDKSKLLSKLYKILQLGEEYIEKAKVRWERDLSILWTNEEWKKVKANQSKLLKKYCHTGKLLQVN